MSERIDADKLANRLLDDASADPNDELRMLSRQLLRRNEVIDRLEKELSEQHDPTLDMIHSNRDSILKIYEEGMRRIAKVVKNRYSQVAQGQMVNPSDLGGDLHLITKIINSVSTFHPMHGESWCGWPKESD